MTGSPRQWAFVRRVLAPNAGPMTLDGTNTWVIGDPDQGPPVVVDPGPDDPAHLEAVLAACGGGARLVLLTHRHLDHTAGASTFAVRAGAAVAAAEPERYAGATHLGDGDAPDTGETALEVISAPGHTSDSLCFLLTPADGPALLLTGDTVLGRGTTVIAAPDGDLGAYFRTLDRLQRVVAEHDVAAILPGHGPVVHDPVRRLAAYVAHRHERLDQVRDALAAGATTAVEVVAAVYEDLEPALHRAALQSVEAQLAYLKAQRPLVEDTGNTQRREAPSKA